MMAALVFLLCEGVSSRLEGSDGLSRQEPGLASLGRGATLIYLRGEVREVADAAISSESRARARSYPGPLIPTSPRACAPHPWGRQAPTQTLAVQGRQEVGTGLARQPGGGAGSCYSSRLWSVARKHLLRPATAPIRRSGSRYGTSREADAARMRNRYRRHGRRTSAAGAEIRRGLDLSYSVRVARGLVRGRSRPSTTRAASSIRGTREGWTWRGPGLSTIPSPPDRDPAVPTRPRAAAAAPASPPSFASLGAGRAGRIPCSVRGER